jgi:hypothetical protein
MGEKNKPNPLCHFPLPDIRKIYADLIQVFGDYEADSVVLEPKKAVDQWNLTLVAFSDHMTSWQRPGRSRRTENWRRDFYSPILALLIFDPLGSRPWAPSV